MNRYDSRSDLQKSIDQYIYVLMVAKGEKNPVRRKALEGDLAYALQVTQEYKERYRRVFACDLFAANENCDAAVVQINAALALLRRVGLESELPETVENPRLILAECAMTLVDTLKAMNAFDAGALEGLVGDVLNDFDPQSVPKVYDAAVRVLVHRYVNGKIPEGVLDRIAVEEGFLHEYLKLLP